MALGLALTGCEQSCFGQNMYACAQACSGQGVRSYVDKKCECNDLRDRSPDGGR